MKRTKRIIGAMVVITIVFGAGSISLSALNLDDWGSFFNTTFRKTADKNLEVVNAANRVLVGQQNLIMELDIPKTEVFKNISQYDLYVYKGPDTLSNYERKYTIKTTDEDKYIKTYSEIKSDAPGLYLNGKSSSTTSYLRFTPNDEFFTGKDLSSADDDFNFEDNSIYTFELTESGKDTYKQTHAEIINGKSIFTLKTKFLNMELENYKINVNQKAVTTLVQRNLEKVPDYKTAEGQEYINSYIDFSYKQTIYNATDATQKIETTYTQNPTDVDCNGGAEEGYPMTGPDDYVCGTEVVSQDTKGILKNPDGKYVVEFGSNLSRDVKNSINIVVPQTKDGYSLIGDDVNSATDVDGIKSTTIHPAKGATTGIANYGVYELESIGYEEGLNAKDLADPTVFAPTSSMDGKISEGEWDPEINLTLAKYDHVVRENTGKYRLENDIDASDTKINTKTDSEGGFGSDGYRPIGIEQIYNGTSITTVAEYNPFNGEITGINPKDSKNNKCIKNLYINDEVSTYIGMISVLGNKGKISDLGIIDPEYIGKHSVGGIAGEISGGKVTDTYIGRVNNGIINNIQGAIVGGIVGSANNGTEITSTKKFEGTISGMDVSGDAQPSKLPDKDGYRTFSNINLTGGSVGGIAGIANTTKIANVYNAGEVLKGLYSDAAIKYQAAGGIVGESEGTGKQVIENSYNKGTVSTIDGTAIGITGVGGILGASSTTAGGETDLTAVYNMGDVSNNLKQYGSYEATFGAGGIVGINGLTNDNLTKITGAYNTAKIASLEVASGGITGITYYTGATLNIDQAYNSGEIDGGYRAGGIIGYVDPRNSLKISSVLNKGKLTADITGGLFGKDIKDFIGATSIENAFSVNEGEYTDINSSLSSAYGYQSIENYIINKATWWTDTLKFDNTTWNLAPGDAEIPLPDYDPVDESQDDNLGTVAREDIQLYPILKNTDGSNLEILEQRRNEMPQTPSQLRYQDFKVNAMTLDVSFKIITIASEDKEGQVKFINSAGDEVLVDDITYDDVETGTYLTIPSKGKLKAGETYTVKFYADGVELDKKGTEIVDRDLKITMPKQIVQDGKTYAEIGDSVNVDTDINEVIFTDKSNPKTVDNYGIYELESIGYEEANPDNIKWDANDLTLAKYDHVIRPINGNYMLGNNIDASATKTLTTADNVGGFGTDGYRPIGKKVDNTDGVPFTGTVSGIGNILDTTKPENYYINNLFINIAKDNIGLVSILNGGNINNLGIIDPKITGAANVGSFAGQAVNGSTLTNVYAAETVDDSEYDISGTTVAGGIIGILDNSIITSDSRFKGEIPGLDLSGDAQPSMLADKDGYKTFNTTDIKSDSITAGIAANAINGSKIDKVYNKGIIKGNPAGIACELYDSIITNAYNTGHLYGKTGTYESAGGIARYAKDSQITNVYNTGRVEAQDNGGGIVGLSSNTLVENTINSGEVSILGTNNSYQAGGIVGTIKGESTLGPLKIMNSINFGKISVPNTTTPSGGIVGSADNSGQGNAELTNVLNVGDVVNGGSIVGLESSKFVLNNGYYLDSRTYNKKTGTAVAGSAFISPSWWTDTLGLSVNEWNIEAGNANIPAPDSDTTDESGDDNQGTVVIGNYPTVKIAGTKYEIPEQKLEKVPAPSTKLEYKINAMNLNVQIKLNKAIELTKADVPITLEVQDVTGSTLLSQTATVSSYGQVVEIENDGKLQGETDYDIHIYTSGAPVSGGYLRIHTPKLDPGKDGDTSTIADNYAYIGDNINSATDIMNAVDSDKIEPDGTNKYGIYELESIGYEDANSTATDWSANDLTLAKYDHITRPVNGNYMLGNNIDASATKTETTADNIGGFGKDGYRPIGKKVDNTDGVPFTGTISGIGNILDTTKPENYYINNLFINIAKDNIGLVSILNGGNINNLGIIDPKITGALNIGSFAGQATNKSKLTNVYATKTIADSSSATKDIVGTGVVGGIAGILDDSTIDTDDRFKGEIPGLDLSGDSQPSMLADKDGYKTFNTLNVESASSNVYQGAGGIVSQEANGATINKVYNKGTISGNAGGIASGMDSVAISNAYNNGTIYSNIVGADNESGGGITQHADNAQIINSYNTGNITSTDNGGGIVGFTSQVTLNNVLNTGDVTIQGATSGIEGGGIFGSTYHSISSSPIIIKNAMNRGNVLGPNKTVKLGGIFGAPDVVSKTNIELTNVLNTGDVANGGSIEATAPATYKLNNVFYLDSGTYNKKTGTAVAGSAFISPSWWTDTLGLSVNDWNIEAGNANIPAPDSDSTDESQDDNQGTVVIGNYPTVKIAGTKDEIPEQKSQKLPVSGVKLDYKINAMNLNIQVRLSKPLEIGMPIQVELHSEGVTSAMLKQNATWTDEGQIVTFDSLLIMDDTNYDIILKSGGSELGKITIHTPKVDDGADFNVVHTDDNTIFIGDGVNAKTDEHDLVDSDQIEPSSTVKYGIYELESIGYEETNPDEADWGANDLTLTKYDHIIRPLNGHYKMKSNIDASDTKNNTADDKDGGFGTDGFTPIGHGVTDGTIVPFKGILDGTGEDSIQNYYIEKFYIKRSGALFPYDTSTGAADYLGLIAETDKAQVHDIGMINPQITGNQYIGSFIGKAQNSSDLFNLYAAENTADSTSSPDYEIVGKGITGGLVGELNNSKLQSDGLFNGSIPGANIEGTQPNNWPDRDGFKVFNTVDVKATSTEADKRGAGGIASRVINHATIENAYNKGTIGGYAGGIAATLDVQGYLDGTYNAGTIKGTEGMGGPESEGAGGLVYRGIDSTITTSYNSGAVEGRDNTGGILGCGYGTSIINSYNTGNVNLDPLKTVTSDKQVGGIVGSVEVGGDKSADISLSRVYNLGKVDITTTLAGTPTIGGIAGGKDSTAESPINMSNSVSFGQVPKGDAISGDSSIGTVKECYYMTGGKFNTTVVGKEVSDENLNSDSWWLDTLRYTPYSFNVAATSSNSPSPDNDPTDESGDDYDGTVARGYVPTIEYNSRKEEVPEQMLIAFSSMKTAYTPTDIYNEKNKAVEKTSKKEYNHGVDISQMQKDNNKKSIMNSTDEEMLDNLKKLYNEEDEETKKKKIKELIDFLENKKVTDPEFLTKHREQILEALENIENSN